MAALVPVAQSRLSVAVGLGLAAPGVGLLELVGVGIGVARTAPCPVLLPRTIGSSFTSF